MLVRSRHSRTCKHTARSPRRCISPPCCGKIGSTTAAVTLIENLDSEKDRADALVMMQDVLPERLLPADVANDERRESLIRREDARAAIDQVGRRQCSA